LCECVQISGLPFSLGSDSTVGRNNLNGGPTDSNASKTEPRLEDDRIVQWLFFNFAFYPQAMRSDKLGYSRVASAFASHAHENYRANGFLYSLYALRL